MTDDSAFCGQHAKRATIIVFQSSTQTNTPKSNIRARVSFVSVTDPQAGITRFVARLKRGTSQRRR
ncbi:hypothetical protein J6590_029128 [Homalodisca vitripennis]|nr:hypothetical protein J6590_029128 [Homalodisca vitripennis]